jgi:hypothetical protein
MAVARQSVAAERLAAIASKAAGVIAMRIAAT